MKIILELFHKHLDLDIKINKYNFNLQELGLLYNTLSSLHQTSGHQDISVADILSHHNNREQFYPVMYDFLRYIGVLHKSIDYEINGRLEKCFADYNNKTIINDNNLNDIKNIILISYGDNIQMVMS
jgi:hypothetical protein